MPAKKKTTSRKPSAPRAPKTFEGTIETVTKRFTDTGTQVLRTLDAAKTELLPLLDVHRELTEACASKREELRDLGEIGDTADKLAEVVASLDEAVENRAEAEARFRAEAHAAREALVRAREREEEEYNYNKLRERRVADDAWADQASEREAELAAKEAAVQKAAEIFAQKADDLSAREAEIEGRLAEEIEKALKDVKRDHAIALNTEKRDTKHALEKAQLVQEQTEARVRDLERALQDASIKLAAAEERANTVATTAIEASADRRALSAVQVATASTGKNTR